MRYSYEEIYFHFGQYDIFTTVQFQFDSEEYQKYGIRLMGTFRYELEERAELESIIINPEVPRTDKKVKFIPSEIETLTDEQKVELDRDGIQASSISSISTLNLERQNRFSKKGTKEIQNVHNIKAPSFSGWAELYQVQFGFLNRRYNDGEELAPPEKIEYWSLRKRFQIENDKQDYIENVLDVDDKTKKKIRFQELSSKMQDYSISGDEIKEFAKLWIEESDEKDKIINREIQRSSQSLKKVAEEYELELNSLKKICNRFEEKVLLFGKKKVFLNFERFVHIYARHVSETQIGERFALNKTVFQYKFEDILRVIEMVLDSISDEIQAHFESNPNSVFRRMGARSVYIDGHYYRVEIESNGLLKDFHPYNDDDNNTGANIG
ncbi:hypothetical protein L1I30_14290 [Gillisia sp. M10.2A]|uniref:Uncharacterized protein n=1 Tax=Gillisia lutea TaxID=2909668 RepID=A0ABS9EJ07_9FLAO|nr:hypothetical protein [Gillisia lutea]MCF4102844.1 hypothetical protein [Gillisia lutea]